MADMMITNADLAIESIGGPGHASPLIETGARFFNDGDRVSYFAEMQAIEACLQRGEPLPSFEAAGPRRRLAFAPDASNCGIVTCGGLCPGINDVIRAIVYEAYQRYRVKRVYGFMYGYQGMVC